MNFVIYKKGFTLVETMVTISIALVIMSVVIYNYSGFNDKVALSSAGQEVAIAIKQAQSYGLDVKGSGNQFGYAYGVYFNPALANQKEYIIFIDLNNNNVFDSGGNCGNVGVECIQKIPIRNNVFISSVCIDGTCYPNGGIRAMDILFRRPSVDAKIYYTKAGPVVFGPGSTAKVVITSPKNNSVNVTIENTGQVSVQ